MIFTLTGTIVHALPPDNSTINDSSISQLSLEYENKSTYLLTDNNVVSSTLMITGFNDTGNGFYWCSVSSTYNTIQTPNPSTIVRIWHQNECSSSQENCNSEIISLYEESNLGRSCTARCADQDINVNIIEAQTCPQVTSITGNTYRIAGKFGEH